MDNCVNAVFPIILYFLASILLLVLIVLVVRLIKTLGKVDKVVDDISYKSSKLDGIFNIVDNATDALSVVSDKMVNFVAGGISKIFNKKKEEE